MQPKHCKALRQQPRPWDVRLMNLQEQLDSIDVIQARYWDPHSGRVQPDLAQGVDAADAAIADTAARIGPALSRPGGRDAQEILA